MNQLRIDKIIKLHLLAIVVRSSIAVILHEPLLTIIRTILTKGQVNTVALASVQVDVVHDLQLPKVFLRLFGSKFPVLYSTW